MCSVYLLAALNTGLWWRLQRGLSPTDTHWCANSIVCPFTCHIVGCIHQCKDFCIALLIGARQHDALARFSQWCFGTGAARLLNQSPSLSGNTVPSGNSDTRTASSNFTSLTSGFTPTQACQSLQPCLFLLCHIGNLNLSATEMSINGIDTTHWT